MLLPLLICCSQDMHDLPPVLHTRDGEVVEDVASWNTRRVPELRADFEAHVYGAAPPAPGVRARLLRRGVTLDGRATFDEVELAFEGLPADAPTIHLLLVLPAQAEGPTPSSSA